METKEEILKKHCNGLPEPRYTQFILPAMQEYADQQNKSQSELIEALRSEIIELEDVSEQLYSSLTFLMSEQNGPPLVRDQESWGMAMTQSEQALTLYKEYKNKQDGK